MSAMNISLRVIAKISTDSADDFLVGFSVLPCFNINYIKIKYIYLAKHCRVLLITKKHCSINYIQYLRYWCCLNLY